MWMPKDAWTERILGGLVVAVVTSLVAGMCTGMCG